MDKQTREILVTDLYQGNDRAEKWESWLSTAVERFRKSPRRDSNVVIQDFPVGNTRHLENRPDKQVAFLLQNLVPDREVKIMDAAFAMRKSRGLPDAGKIEDIIQSNREEYGKYEKKCRPLVSLMTATRGFIKGHPAQAFGNAPHSERVFRLKGGYSFLGKERIRTDEDVAWIFRSLEQKGIEHTFFVLSRGRQNIILEAGIGCSSRTIVDLAGVLKAAKILKAEQITMVHNHPSGLVMASRQDIDLYRSLRSALGERLRPAIILDTDSGIYGVFDESTAEQHEFTEKAEDRKKMVDIPVFTFDTTVFTRNDPDKEWRLRDSRQIASFLSAQRFGEKTKMGFLCLNGALKIAGNFHLPYDGITADNIKEIASDMVDAAISVNAGQCVIYGKGKGLDIISRIEGLAKGIDRQSAHIIKLLDAIEIKDSECLHYMSACDNGMIPHLSEHSPADKYGKDKFEAVDIIRISDGRSMIRAKKNGEYLPAEMLRKADMENLAKGTLTKEEAAELYFKNTEISKMDRGGMKR